MKREMRLIVARIDNCGSVEGVSHTWYVGRQALNYEWRALTAYGRKMAGSDEPKWGDIVQISGDFRTRKEAREALAVLRSQEVAK